ncbi:MAG: zf-HC2 domain-containing protein [Gemmatimonadales bacterium]
MKPSEMKYTPCLRANSPEIALYVYDELESRARDEVELHVATCESCTTAASELADLRRRTETIPRDVLSRDIVPRVMGAIRDARQEPRPVSRRSGSFPRAMQYFAGTLVAACIAGLIVVRGRNDTAPNSVGSRSDSSIGAPLEASARALAAPGAATLDRTIAELEAAAAKSPGDQYLQRLIARTRSDRAALTTQVRVITSSVR